MSREAAVIQVNVSETRKRVVQVLLAVVLFTALWATLHYLSDLLIDYPKVIEWLGKQEWLLFFNPEIRDFILRQTWQMLLALIITVKGFPRIYSLAGIIAERYLPQFPSILDYPTPGRDWLDFPARQLTLVGRRQELAKLKNFVDQKSRFSWWWLNGKGGSGKSRLVLEWMLSLPKPLIPRSSYGYDAGFLRDPIDQDEWKSWRWKPRHPTVIVIDDAAEHVEATLSLLRILGQRAAELDYPVRVLLVERTIPEQLRKLNEESHFYDHRYSLDPLTISPLGPQPIQELAKELSKKRGKPLTLTTQTVEHIHYISQGLPLFLILALDDLIEYGQLRNETKGDLLKKEYQRTLAKFRQHGLDEKYLPMVALATLTRGLPWAAAKTFLKNTECPKKTLLDPLFQQDTVAGVPPLQPDILGEYFLLEQFGTFTEPERQRFLRTAWKNSPGGVASMLYKIALDFPEHPQSTALDQAPKQPKTAVWWGRVHVSLLAEINLPVKKIELYLRELHELGQTHPGSAEIQLTVARGLGSANYLYRSRQLWDHSLETFHNFIDFAKSHRENSDIQIVLAQTAASVIEYYGRGQHVQELEDALKVQADLDQVESLRQNADFQLTLATSAARATKAGNWKNFEAGFQRLNEIAREFPQHREIQLVLANVAVEALYQWYDDELDWDPFFSFQGPDAQHRQGLEKPALKTLRDIANRDIGDKGEVHFGVAAGVRKTLILPIFDWNRLQISVEILEAVAIRNPENVDIQIQFAKGAGSAMFLYERFKQGNWTMEMQAISQKLKEVIPKHFHNHEDIRESLMEGQNLLAKP